MKTPFLYHAWVAASRLILPFVARNEQRKLARAGVSTARAREKLGYATEPRRDGPLIWFHAASVGESLSVLALITRIGVALPRARFLITSGTATSAALVGRRLPARAVHQFAPLDAPGPLKRFLTHWSPDAAVFVESEIWPQMLRRTRATGAKMALVNARLSEKSQKGWKKRSALARYLFEVFDLILTQNDAMADAMIAMNAPADRVERGINLKSMSDPLPQDMTLIDDARTAYAHRPLWVASSTHEGEEQIVLAAHRKLRERWPDLGLILAPRHPDRAAEVRELVLQAGFEINQRSMGNPIGGDVYLADTMGELGNWYALSPIVFLGGSLKPIGGHNPYEVAQAGATVLSGVHVANFAETFAQMEALGAAHLIADMQGLARQVDAFLSDDVARRKACQASATFVGNQTDLLDGIAQRMISALGLGPHG